MNPNTKAYHMIGLSTLDTGRLASTQSMEAEIIEHIAERAKRRYDAIWASGKLLPSREEKANITRGQGHFFVEDILAEDNRFVFLSIGRRYWQRPDRVNFGFVFDARQLIEQGAILRQHDLMGEYSDILGEIVAKRTGFREPTTWTEAERDMLFEALEHPDEHPEYSDPNDAYYHVLDAVEHLRYEDPEVIETIAAFRGVARRVQEEIQMSGSDALRYLDEHEANGLCEILVPDHLELAQTIGFIEYGEEYGEIQWP